MKPRQFPVNDATQKLISDHSAVVFNYLKEVMAIISQNPPKILAAKTKEEAIQNFKASEETRLLKMTDEERKKDLNEKQTAWGSGWPENEYQSRANAWQAAYDLWIKETPCSDWATRVTNYVSLFNARLFNKLPGNTAESTKKLLELETQVNNFLSFESNFTTNASEKPLLKKFEKKFIAFLAACQHIEDLDILVHDLIRITDDIVKYYFEPLQKSAGWKEIHNTYFPVPNVKLSKTDRELFKKNVKAFEYLVASALLSQLNAVLTSQNTVFATQTMELAANLIFKKIVNQLHLYKQAAKRVQQNTRNRTSVNEPIHEEPIIKECKEYIVNNIKSVIRAIFNSNTFYDIATENLETHFQKCITSRNLGLHKKYIDSQPETVMSELLLAIKTAFTGFAEDKEKSKKSKEILAGCIVRYIVTHDYESSPIDAQKAYKDLILAIEAYIPTHFFHALISNTNYNKLIKWARQIPHLPIAHSSSAPIPVSPRLNHADHDSESSVRFSDTVTELSVDNLSIANAEIEPHHEKDEREKEPLAAENPKLERCFSVNSLSSKSDSAIPSPRNLNTIPNLLANKEGVTLKKNKKTNHAQNTLQQHTPKKPIVRMRTGIYQKPATKPSTAILSNVLAKDAKQEVQDSRYQMKKANSEQTLEKSPSRLNLNKIVQPLAIQPLAISLMLQQKLPKSQEDQKSSSIKKQMPEKLQRCNASLNLQKTLHSIPPTPRASDLVSPRTSNLVSQGSNNFFVHPPRPEIIGNISLTKIQPIAPTSPSVAKKEKSSASKDSSTKHKSLQMFTPAQNTLSPKDSKEKAKKGGGSNIKSSSIKPN